ncbi:DUF6154 family protein [Aliibacillus thermotolerans]|uniref:DUF6154 family protein n=1 Tax=Aliibacillus thermotolerans TaxID=1834418 RepID=A0ABW0UBI9_9BACI|nr:DUF6154 family protein [Aliibacillus thermotolerans]MDA3129926.1 hypothetical protein [Aliibacillus thermotolerans]
MDLIDKLYELYKNELTGNEEDAFIIIEGILEDLSDDDIQQLITDLSARDRYEMMALFLYEQLRLKIAEEGIGTTTNREKFYH